jgi:hypothetical protein
MVKCRNIEIDQCRKDSHLAYLITLFNQPLVEETLTLNERLLPMYVKFDRIVSPIDAEEIARN